MAHAGQLGHMGNGHITIARQHGDKTSRGVRENQGRILKYI
jgi:hypothetical protein